MDYQLVGTEIGRGHRLGVVAGRKVPSGGRKTPSKCTVADDTLDGGCERVCITRWDEKCRGFILEKSLQTTNLGRNERCSDRERFQSGERKTLPVRREHDGLRGAHQRPRIRSSTREHHPAGHTLSSRMCLQLLLQRPCADDHERNAGKTPDGRYGQRVVLLGDKPPDAQYERLISSQAPLTP